MVDNLCVDEGGVDEDERDVEMVSQHPIPVEDRLADIRAGQEQIGPGELAHRRLIREQAPDVGAGVGADVARVTGVFGLGGDLLDHAGRPAERAVVFGIEDVKVERL